MLAIIALAAPIVGVVVSLVLSWHPWHTWHSWHPWHPWHSWHSKRSADSTDSAYQWVGRVATVSVGAVLVCGIALAVQVIHKAPVITLFSLIRVDALSAFMMILIGSVALLATSHSVRYIAVEVESGKSSHRRALFYFISLQIFVGAMLLAVLANNLGIMWIAIEATTIATTFLIAHRRTDGSLEASWKYIVICSVGIAMAFLGTALIYLAQETLASHIATHHITTYIITHQVTHKVAHQVTHQVSSNGGGLNWTSLMAVSHHLNPGIVRLAMALLVIGYGTKAGLMPLHSWLPDAHSQAPAPVSALMSGVLLSVAIYALLRFKAIADGALGPTFPRALFIGVGLLTLVMAASLLIAQRDYKRMLAYSSIEHMGLIALGIAAGSPLAIAAVLLHMIGHGLAKSVLFLTSGEILLAEGTSEIAKIKSLLVRRPALGALFALGLIALLGLPPFSLFVSEFNMFRAELQAGLGWIVVISLFCLVVVFSAMFSHGRGMLFGGQGSNEKHHLTPTPSTRTFAPLILALGICCFLGLMAWPLESLLNAAARVVA